jgi:tetratricopeptide (TPR) repeat protein
MLANPLLLNEVRDEKSLISELQRTIDSTGSSKALYMMGALHNIRGRYPEAIWTLMDARLQENKEAIVKRTVYNGLGFAYSAQGNMTEAIRYYERSNRVVEDAETYYNIGSAYLYRKKADLNRLRSPSSARSN